MAPPGYLQSSTIFLPFREVDSQAHRAPGKGWGGRQLTSSVAGRGRSVGSARAQLHVRVGGGAGGAGQVEEGIGVVRVDAHVLRGVLHDGLLEREVEEKERASVRKKTANEAHLI